MKKVLICWGLMLVCIVTAVITRISMNSEELDYKEVKVQVVSSEAKEKRVKTKYSTSYVTEYDIVVRYEGQKYVLKNAHDAYSYREGSTVTAYLFNGKLYANVEGVQSASPMGIAYSASLIGTFGFFILSMLLLTKVGQKKESKT